MKLRQSMRDTLHFFACAAERWLAVFFLLYPLYAEQVACAGLSLPLTAEKALLALALGAGKWHMVRTVVLPNAVDGIVTGCILAVGRIVGESAALLFTAGFGLELNNFITSLQASSATLTVALYVYANERGETGVAFAIAAVLMLLVFLINFAATLAGKKLKRKAG